MLKETKNTVYITVTVGTNRSEFRINIKNNKLLVFLKEKPIKGKANEELVKQFTKLFKKPVCLVAGCKSKNKTLKIECTNKGEVLEILDKIKR